MSQTTGTNSGGTKDWTGGQRSIYTTLGASNHTDNDRQEHDYYATDPKAMELLLAEEKFAPVVWECACGEGHLSKVLEAHGYTVISTDLVYRGYGCTEPLEFLKCSPSALPSPLKDFSGDIITNPPYKYALQFVEKSLDMVRHGGKVAMFLRLQFLEGKARRTLFDKAPPKRIYVCSSRLTCAMNGRFQKYSSGAVAYAWFVWEKGFKGDPIVKWIN